MPAHGSVELSSVIDQGPTWVFHLSAQGVNAAPIGKSRDRLRADHWRLTIPTSAGRLLRDAGEQPPAG